MNSYQIILLIVVIVLIIMGFVYGRNLANTSGVTMGDFQRITLMIIARPPLVI